MYDKSKVRNIHFCKIKEKTFTDAFYEPALSKFGLVAALCVEAGSEQPRERPSTIQAKYVALDIA